MLLHGIRTGKIFQFSSVQFSPSVMSNSLRSHESQQARPLCPQLLQREAKRQTISEGPGEWTCLEENAEAAGAQFSLVAQSCPTPCDPMNWSAPGLLVHHQLPEFTQTHVHRVSDAIQPSHPLLSPSLPVPNPFQHQGLFQ